MSACNSSAAAFPAGPVLATTIWGNSASWDAGRAAAVHLDGRDLFRTKLSEEMFRGLAPWLNWHPGPADARQRAGLRHLRLGVGLVGRDLRHRRQDRAAGTEEARLRRDGLRSARSPAPARSASSIPPSITMVIYAVAANVSIIQVFLAGFLPGLLVMVLYSGYIAVLVAAPSGKNTAG